MPLLGVLTVAALANTIRLQLYVKPPLLTARASLHLLRSECFVKLPLDRQILNCQRRLLVVACKLRTGLVKFARGAVFGGALLARAADGIAC